MKWGGGKFAFAAKCSTLALAVSLLGFPKGAHAEVQPAPEPSLTQPQLDRAITMSVPLVWSGQVLGDVIIQVDTSGSVAIESQSLRKELVRLLNDAGAARLDQAFAGDPFVSEAQVDAVGISVSFDEALLQLTIDSIDPTLRPVEPLRGRSENSDRLLPSMEPAEFSAYLNSSVNLLYGDRDGLMAPDVFLFGAARYRDVVLEVDGGFTRDLREDYRLYRRAARAVYDEPDSYRRWSAGDLRLQDTGVLRSPFIGGVAVEKSRRIFDPFAPTVTLGGRQIFITSPSTVEVIVNGAPYQTLDLQPGTYSLDDLPIQLGSNDVQLVVRDASGREQITRFDYFFDPIDLEAGEEEYSAAIGFVANDAGLQPQYSGDPAALVNYRRALNDILILGGGVQVSEDLQVLGFEAQAVPQIVPGSFDLQAAVSTGDGTGFAVRGGYRVNFGSMPTQKRFSATFDYQSENFRTVGDLSGFRLERLSVNATYSQSLSLRTTLVAGANYFSRTGGADQSTFFVDVNHRLKDNIRASVGVEYGTGPFFKSNFGVRAGITVLLGGRHRADAAYESRRDLARASLSRGTQSHVGSLGYSVNVQSSQGSASADGIVDYIGNRFEARASLGSSGNGLSGIIDDQIARLQFGTSLAFADGAFGIGRPIQDSFLLARPHRTLGDVDVISGRSLREGEYEAASGTLGAGVVNRLTSYNAQDVQYDTETVKAGYDIGSGVVRVEPPYRAGYDLLVGTDRFVSAVGFLEIAGAPAALVSGIMTSDDDKGFEPRPFFTNSAGRFGIVGLAPGRTYVVKLQGSGRTFTIAVPADNTGLLKLGRINLPDPAQ